MDGSRRIDVNLHLNNNYNNNQYHHDHNHHHHHHLHHHHHRNGHTFISLLLQPSSLRSTPDIDLNLNHGWNNNASPSYHSGSGLGLGFHEDHPMGQRFDYTHGPFESNDPLNYSHIFPEIPPFGNNNENFIGRHYYEPSIDGVDYGYPPNFHYSATSGAPSAGGFEHDGSGPPATEEIMFGGRVIQATPVQLVPVIPPAFVTSPETAYSAPPMGQGFSRAPFGVEVMFSHSQGVAATLDIREHLEFPRGDLNHLVAAQQYTQHDPNPITSLEVNVNPHYIQERERLPPREVGDGAEYIIDEDDIYVELQDWVYEAITELEERARNLSRGLHEVQVLNVVRRERFHRNSPNGDAPCCSICLEEFEEEEDLGVLRNCSHQFHFECIKPWLSRKNTCPLCREVV